MDDLEVIDEFVQGSSAAVFGPSLNVERGALKLDGWWSVAYRVSPRTFIVRDEEAPTESTVADDVAAALTGRGLSAVGADLPAIALLTYTILDLGYAPWVLWSTDLATGEAEINAKATEESFLEGGSVTGPATATDSTTDLRSARRIAGAPTRIVLTIGVNDRAVGSVRDGLGDSRFEVRALGEIQPGDCGSLLPTLVLVDATGPDGKAFVVALQPDDGVSGPVVAITADGALLAGADATVDAADPPERWVSLIQDLLPY